jgi:hypothetical protein
MNSIDNWSDKWLENFNLKKTENLLVTRRTVVNRVPIYIKREIIPYVHKHLGVHLSNDLSWKDHIEIVLKKRLGILLSLKYKFSRHALETLYMSFIRSIVEYGDIAYDNCFDYLKD